MSGVDTASIWIDDAVWNSSHNSASDRPVENYMVSHQRRVLQDCLGHKLGYFGYKTKRHTQKHARARIRLRHLNNFGWLCLKGAT